LPRWSTWRTSSMSRKITSFMTIPTMTAHFDSDCPGIWSI